MNPQDARIAADFDAGRARGLARAISRAENGRGEALLRHVADRRPHAATIGVTGPPGVGKSTLCAGLVALARAAGRRVGVLTVDPSSPFTHGAILGDRIRLREHATDSGVFVRSMASRGHLGGLAGATADALALMDAFGHDVIFVETVGVGQSEIEIADVVQTTLVVLQPGSGDGVQMLKAGILEIADVLVVNKADDADAPALVADARAMLEMRDGAAWTPPVIATTAHDGGGLPELQAAIERHRAYATESGALDRKRRATFAFRVRGLAIGRLEPLVAARAAAAAAEVRSDSGAGDPYRAAEAIVAPIARAFEAAERACGD